MKCKIKVMWICMIITIATALLAAPPKEKQKPFAYPEAKKCDHVDDYFGTKVADPYRWMEDTNSPDTKAWVKAEVNLTDSYFASKSALRSKIKSRLTGLYYIERYTTPEKSGDYYFYDRNNGHQEQYAYYMQKGLNGTPELLIDPNTLSKDNSVNLEEKAISKDTKYLAYSISRGGSDWRELYVMDLQTKTVLQDHIEYVKFSNISWYKDGFFYSRYDKPSEDTKLKDKVDNQKVYYHKVGTAQSDDKLIFQDLQNPYLGFDAQVSEDEKYLVITSWGDSSDFNTILYKNLETDSPIASVIDKFYAHFIFVDDIDGKLLFATDCDAPNYKGVLIDPAKPGKESWETIIPESADKLEDVSIIDEKLILTYIKDASSHVAVFDLKGKPLYDLPLPGIGSVGGISGKRDNSEMFFSFTSYSTPTTVYRCDLNTKKIEIYRKPNMDFDPANFEVKQVFYESKDKTRVPLFIVYKKGLVLNGKNPTLLYAYGGFNSPMLPYFRTHYIPFMEAGGVFAVACIRGGSEYGEKWHQAGMLDKKQNVFDDFIAAGEYLIKEKYTTASRLAVMGGSNGGLLIGAVVNQRPDLFRVGIPMVGVMDMLRFQYFTIGRSWASEYGSSENKDQFKYIYAYSPLHNIKEGVEYPAILVTTADHDDRVFPAHSFKYTAALQEKYKGTRPMLIRIETQVGHGAGAALSKQVELYADVYTFVLENVEH